MSSKYLKIYNDIVGKIDSGIFEANTKLPSESQLMDEYNVSRDTVRKSLNLLEQNGYIEKSKGKGSFVLDMNKFDFPVSGIKSFKEIENSLGKECETILEELTLKSPSDSLMKKLEVSPNKYVTEEVLADFYENILDKTLIGIREEGFDFKGVIFFGIMITEEGAKLLEYNVRMGDPETQSVLSLMESDLVDVILNALDEKLNETTIKWNEGYCVNVVLSSKGYPEAYEKGYEISIDESLKGEFFIAGAKKEGDTLVTSGGRVLSVVGKGKTLEEAKENAYKNIEKVNFEGMYFRKDIGTAK